MALEVSRPFTAHLRSASLKTALGTIFRTAGWSRFERYSRSGLSELKRASLILPGCLPSGQCISSSRTLQARVSCRFRNLRGKRCYREIREFGYYRPASGMLTDIPREQSVSCAGSAPFEARRFETPPEGEQAQVDFADSSGLNLTDEPGVVREIWLFTAEVARPARRWLWGGFVRPGSSDRAALSYRCICSHGPGRPVNCCMTA